MLEKLKKHPIKSEKLRKTQKKLRKTRENGNIEKL